MKLKFWSCFITLCMMLPNTMNGQTIGLILQTEDSYNGHVLFAPNASRTVYLVDNCGHELHSWTTQHSPGLSVYLLENGDLLKTSRIPSSFNGGGSGGRIERRSWENELMWAYDFSTSSYHQHHDIQPMPNGNILVIAWEQVEESDLASSGRIPTGNAGFWSTYIFEVKPIGHDEMEIVWEWRAWDHLIQDADSSSNNFGVVADHPELIDVNLDPGLSADWLHVNGIDYNQALDQIALSVHDIDEIFIIDHSTTTAEAKTNEGGDYGKGGDLLYRWGNPQNYGRGGNEDQLLFGQHDVRWIEDGKPGAGSLTVFNNGARRPGPVQFSTVDEWLPTQDSAGYYQIAADQPFGPPEASWSVGQGDVIFYSSRISGAERLENGNTLICSGRMGNMLEVDSAGTLVWNYINPVSNSPLVQGTTPFANDLFRTSKYPLDYSAFDGRNLVPGNPIELDPLPYICDLYLSNEEVILDETLLTVYPNPAVDFVHVKLTDGKEYSYQVAGIDGRIIIAGKLQYFLAIDLKDFVPGLYHIHVIEKDNYIVHSSKFVVQ